MPVKQGKDSKGSFFRWGNKTKYYYKIGSAVSRARAKAKAKKQGKAAYSRGYKSK